MDTPRAVPSRKGSPTMFSTSQNRPYSPLSVSRLARRQTKPQKGKARLESHLSNVHLHARHQVVSELVHVDHEVDQFSREINSTSFRCSSNLFHCGTNHVVDRAVGKSQPSGVEVSDGTYCIETSVVDQLSPPTEAYIRYVVSNAFASSSIDLAELLGFLILELRVKRGISESANSDSIIVILFDFSWTDLVGANKAHTRQDDVSWKRFEKWLLDIQAILNEHDDRMTRCNSRPDEVDEQWRHIRNILGSADDIFERLQILLVDIRYRLQD